MPIHDVGYRAWKGKLTASWSRWWAISEIGIRTALSSRWIRRIILASWLPVIYFGIGFFAFETVMETSYKDLARGAGGEPVESIISDAEEFEKKINQDGDGVDADVTGNQTEEANRKQQEREFALKKQIVSHTAAARNIPNGRALEKALESGDESTLRRTVWSFILSTFLRYPQGMVTLMIVGLVVPPLISRDVRSRAFLLYYSRPITRFEYLTGKLVVPAFILALVTFVPAFMLYFVGLMLSPDLSVLRDTWDLPFRVGLASAVCIIPTCLVGLLFSAMTQESRFAGFAWFTVWGLGAVVWFGIYMANSQGGSKEWDSNWSLISIYSTIGRVQSWIFGLELNPVHAMPSLIALVVISLFSFLLLYRRISAPIRA